MRSVTGLGGTREISQSFEPSQPPPPPHRLHLHHLRLQAPGEPVEGGGGEVTEVVFKGWMMSDTEEEGEDEGQGEVSEEQKAVSGEEDVEEILLNSDHVEWESSEGWGVTVVTLETLSVYNVSLSLLYWHWHYLHCSTIPTRA